MIVWTSRVKLRFLNDSLQTATDFLNSFYLDDLDRLSALVERTHPFGKTLNSYFGPALDEQKRIDILTEHTTMAHLVSAKQLPSARWACSIQVSPYASATGCSQTGNRFA